MGIREEGGNFESQLALAGFYLIGQLEPLSEPSSL